MDDESPMDELFRLLRTFAPDELAHMRNYVRRLGRAYDPDKEWSFLDAVRTFSAHDRERLLARARRIARQYVEGAADPEDDPGLRSGAIPDRAARR